DEQMRRIPRHRRGRGCVQRWRRPTLGLAAGESLAVFLSTEQIARRVAIAAMAEPINEIGAAIPFGALPRISAVWRVVEIEQVPERDDPALVQREGQRV